MTKIQTPNKFQIPIANNQTGYFLFGYWNLIIGHCLVIVSCILVIYHRLTIYKSVALLADSTNDTIRTTRYEKYEQT